MLSTLTHHRPPARLVDHTSATPTEIGTKVRNSR